MRRRTYLAGLIAGAGSLAGCTAVPHVGSGNDQSTSTTTGDAATATMTAGADATSPDLPIPKDELVIGAPRDAIPAITGPSFGRSWATLDDVAIAEQLHPDDEVIGVERNGEARAYPLRVLNWHEIVNDDFHGPLLVTYCPLCGSAVTAVRTVKGEETLFGVSGYLYRSDLVMYDRLTNSLWSQIMATAINGPQTGETLTLVPSTLTTWREWQNAQPDTKVLLPPPESDTIGKGTATRNYAINPYSEYDEMRRVGIGVNTVSDERLHPKARVIGVEHDGTAKAYPLDAVANAGVVNDAVGGLPVVVTVTADDSLVAYERTVEGTTLTFETDGRSYIRGGDTRFERVTGRAVSGRFEGAQLTRANDTSPMFWFAWVDFHPDSALYQR